MRHTVARSLAVIAATALMVGLSACSQATPKANTTPTGASLSSVKVALVPGGPHPYFQPWKDAGTKAKSDFGLGDVTFNETGGWDQTKQNDVINSLVANGYNAFGIFGVSPTDINTTFKTLKDAGVSVASLASCPAGNTNNADFCLSTDVSVAAYKAAKATITAMGGKGTLAHLTGNNVDSNTQRRIAGVQKAVDETNGAVILLPAVTDIDKDLTTAQKAVADLLAAHGTTINGIVTTAYNPAVAAASAVKASGLAIKVVAIDDDPTILAGIADGSVAATVTQNPVGQGYVGAWALGQLASKACTMKSPGLIIDSGSFIVTKDNVKTFDQDRQKMTAQIQSDFTSKYFDCK